MAVKKNLVPNFIVQGCKKKILKYYQPNFTDALHNISGLMECCCLRTDFMELDALKVNDQPLLVFL